MHPAPEHHLETPAEETASSITHFLGMLLSLAGLAILIVLATNAGDARRITTVSIYGTTLLLMYTASTSYHFVKRPELKHTLRIFDHASIYLLIAGTYTPVLLVSMRGSWGWSLFGVVWGLAVTGVILKLFFIGRYEKISVTLYILMGWIALVGVRPFIAALPMPGIGWIVGGGLAYTGGVVFYLWDKLPFNHAIWHLFVLAGSICHFFAVLLYVLPMQ